jgi:YggT family protein
MGIIALILYWAFVVYFYVLVGRFIIDLVRSLNPAWRPKGLILILAELAFTVTEPPLKFLRRFIKPIRFGMLSFDLAWTVLFIVVIVLRDVVRSLIA